MGGLKKAFGSWWVLSTAAALLIALVLVVLLPMVAGVLRPWWVRLLLLLLIAVAWSGLALWRVLSARSASKRLVESLTEASAAPGDAEAETLAKRMSEALAGLKTASANRRDYLYSRPWFVIIGPPGAGKTTALLNSGLQFPFSDTALKGVGGTRNLDFWFADEAVLVDTAGRFTTQDSDVQRDRAAWAAFLGLLRRHRPLQPINGVLVAIGLDSLIGGDAARIDAASTAVRRRLNELQTGLESATPVYVIFTKSDLIAGFSEFYDDLDVEGRRAVVGATLDWKPGAPVREAEIVTAFDEVAQSIADRASKRLNEDLDARRRGLIVGYPAQIQALRGRITRFLMGAFPADAPEGQAPLRGFYLTSGVQQGAPLDRLLSGMAQVYDAPIRAAGPGGGRAYFINRLLHDVVIAEAGLVQTSAKARARRLAGTAGALAAIAGVSLLVLVAWTVSFLANRQFQQRLTAGAHNSQEELRAGGFDMVEARDSDPDLEASLSVLRGLRNLPGGYAERLKGGHPLAQNFGLYPSGESRAASQAYLEALERLMAPRILLRLERYLQDHRTDALALYEPLKVYLTLGGQAPSLDKAAVKAWVETDWASSLYPGADREDVRKQLGEHLDALLADPQFGAVWPDRRAPLDGDLIASSRTMVQTLSLADRAYALLKQKAAAAGGGDWRADAVLSSGDAKAFANGAQVLADSVPFLFTRKGFTQAYVAGLQTVALDLEQDLWVMGQDREKESLRAQMAAVRPGVSQLYAHDYMKAWDDVAASIQPGAYFTDAQAFGAATGSPPPLKTLLLDIVKNTDFGGGTAMDNASKVITAKIPRALKGLSAGALDTGSDAGRQITDHFKPLRTYVGDGKAPAPIDDFIAKLKAAVIAKGGADRAGSLGGGDAAQGDLAKAMSELAAASAGAPPIVQAITSSASKQGDTAQVVAAQGAVSGDYDKSVGPACRSAVENRYPFVANSANDAPIGDLLRVFGMNGQVDQLVQTRLRPLLDTSGPVWRWRSDDKVAATLDPTSAGEFQKSAEIRDLLLSGVSIKVDSQGLGGGITAAELSAGGQTYRFDAGQSGQRVLQWTTSSLPEARVTLFNGTQKVREFALEGPWALFRLMDAAKKENAGPTAFKATFGEGAAYVTFRVALPNEHDPFSRGGMWSFRCPPRL